jgi:predicted dithiol-disulfide oxidoreductase (DUF899 family)
MQNQVVSREEWLKARLDTVSEQLGISVFARNERNEVSHTYSCYARGVDIVNGAYHYLDLTPKGRDEGSLKFTIEWVRRNDQYRGEARR